MVLCIRAAVYANGTFSAEIIILLPLYYFQHSFTYSLSHTQTQRFSLLLLMLLLVLLLLKMGNVTHTQKKLYKFKVIITFVLSLSLNCAHLPNFEDINDFIHKYIRRQNLCMSYIRVDDFIVLYNEALGMIEPKKIIIFNCIHMT